MKTSTIALIGLGALGLYLLLKQRNAGVDAPSTALGPAFTPIDAGTVTPAGNLITQPITSVQQGLDYINQNTLGKSNLVALPSPRSTQGSYAILAPRKGGGYTQVGASNVTLRENPAYKPTASYVRDSKGKYTITNTRKPSPTGKAPWNKYY